MSLHDQIIELYPQIISGDFQNGKIILQNDSDGMGDYIKAWNHPTLPHPPFGHDPHKPESEAE